MKKLMKYKEFFDHLRSRPLLGNLTAIVVTPVAVMPLILALFFCIIIVPVFLLKGRESWIRWDDMAVVNAFTAAAGLPHVIYKIWRLEVEYTNGPRER